MFFAAPPGRNVGDYKSSLGSGIDIRRGASYVILPHSMHRSGKRYSCEGYATPKPLQLTAELDALLLRKERPLSVVPMSAHASATQWETATSQVVSRNLFGVKIVDKVSRGYRVHCPQHDDRSPSAIIYKDGGCFCQASCGTVATGLLALGVVTGYASTLAQVVDKLKLDGISVPPSATAA